ncbi:MAG: hypothetical protein K2I08_08475 [Muribaculaceae bacterium]|nr:hypothetical protein [Muribaculaceae bacterium]
MSASTDYRGNVIYSDGKVDMVLFPGGYATIKGTSVTFHYYTQDYLGKNRAVINGSTGAIEQTVGILSYLLMECILIMVDSQILEWS